MSTSAYDRGYLEGRRRTLINRLQHDLIELHGLGFPLPTEASLVLERAEAIAALRTICAEHGDNDWDDDLHLCDIIEKHLGRCL